MMIVYVLWAFCTEGEMPPVPIVLSEYTTKQECIDQAEISKKDITWKWRFSCVKTKK